MSYQLNQESDSYHITRDGNEVLRYTFEDFDFHPNCHPVRTPAGDNLTLIRSADHPWHEGLYFSWKYINGRNVWERDFIGEPWGKPVHVDIQPDEDEGTKTGLRHHIQWVDSEGEAMVDDVRRVIVGEVTEDDAYSLDWEITTTALIDEVVFDRKVEWGAYAGMHFRFVRSVAPKIRNSVGEENIQEDNKTLAEWMDYNFYLDGHAGNKNFEYWAGVTTMNHPSNFLHPTPFTGYFAKHIQSLHVPVVRDEPLTIKKGESFTLRYRHMIYDGKISRERIDRWYADYKA